MEKLTRDTYFNIEMNKKYMSCSQYKDFKKCQAMAVAKINGDFSDEDKECFTEGNFMDSLFERTSESFIEKHPEIVSSKGVSKGELKSNYLKAQQTFELMHNDENFMKMCLGEQQKVFVGEIAGVEFKILVDSLLTDTIVDRKYVKDIKNTWSEEFSCRVPFFVNYGYDVQGAIYQEIVRQNIGKKLPFVLAVMTKEKVPDHDLIKIDDELLDKIMENEIIPNAPYFNQIKNGLLDPERCNECDFCKLTKTAELHSAWDYINIDIKNNKGEE